jgi:methionyl-tRNA formyltransferase
MKLRFAFLVLKEHPYGREMLRILLERGYRPGLIIEEDSTVADEERGKFLTRIAGQPVPPTISKLVAGLDIPCHTAHNHNSLGCLETLREYGPDLVVLGGTRIIRPPVLAVPSLGTINSHPGLLPRLRGSSSVGWALYKDLPVGATVHFVDARIDTGPVLLRRHLPVYRGERYEQIVRRVLTLSGELMVEALTLIECGTAQPRPQDPAEGETLRVIPPQLLAEAKSCLTAGLYSHFAAREVRDDANEPSRS